jgi:hypothetical protein
MSVYFETGTFSGYELTTVTWCPLAASSVIRADFKVIWLLAGVVKNAKIFAPRIALKLITINAAIRGIW